MEKSFVTLEQNVCPIYGRVALVEINEPSDPNNLTLNNVDRTGKIGWMKRDIVQQLIPEFPEDKFMCYVENGFFKEMEE